MAKSLSASRIVYLTVSGCDSVIFTVKVSVLDRKNDRERNERKRGGGKHDSVTNLISVSSLSPSPSLSFFLTYSLSVWSVRIHDTSSFLAL